MYCRFRAMGTAPRINELRFNEPLVFFIIKKKDICPDLIEDNSFFSLPVFCYILLYYYNVSNVYNFCINLKVFFLY